ncbi:MAG: hypothetical protein AB7E95_02845 [Kiritimatiellales bacterium]
MKIPKSNKALIIASAIAGFLSGLIHPLYFGIRGALFGIGLAATIILVRKHGWRILSFSAALIIAILLAVMPYPTVDDLLITDRSITTALNCIFSILAMAYAYLRPRWRRQILLLLLSGLLSSVWRALSMEATWSALMLSMFPFLMGSLPFLILWFTAVLHTDPVRETNGSRINRTPAGEIE